MEVVPKTSNIRTRAEFGDSQLHVERAAPSVIKGESQGRGNSGVFLMRRYEIQVLDGYQNPTYADGTTAAIYGESPPSSTPAASPKTADCPLRLSAHMPVSSRPHRLGKPRPPARSVTQRLMNTI